MFVIQFVGNLPAEVDAFQVRSQSNSASTSTLSRSRIVVGKSRLGTDLIWGRVSVVRIGCGNCSCIESAVDTDASENSLMQPS